MVSKNITIIQDDNNGGNKRRRARYFSIGNQASLENLLRQLKVDVLLENNEYSCEVNRYNSLMDGGQYTLGESFSSSVELKVLDKTK